MYYITETTLFKEKLVIYTDPITGKEVKTTVTDFAAGVVEARRTVLTQLSREIGYCMEKYYSDLLQFADIKGKAKNSINESRKHLKSGITQLTAFSTLGSLAAHIYENIIPYLHSCTIKSNKYFELLHILENQVVNYSDKHQLTSDKPEFVKS